MFDLGAIDQLPATLAAQPMPLDAVGLIEEVDALETAVCALRARQARAASALVDLRAAEERRPRMARIERSVGAEVALARRIAPARGRRFVALARVLAETMPRTRAAFEAGRLDEARVGVLVAETECVSAEHRARIDAALADDPVAVGRQGERELRAAARGLACSLDAASVVERRRRAEGDRRVTIRPAADSMVYLTAALPVREGVSVYAALRAAATAAVASGEASGIGQGMADHLVRCITGRPVTEPLPLRLRVTVPARALVSPSGEVRPGDVATLSDATGAIRVDALPVELAREWVAGNLAHGARVELQRLFADPVEGSLVAMESSARRFPAALADFIAVRDGWCRTPYCNAPGAPSRPRGPPRRRW